MRWCTGVARRWPLIGLVLLSSFALAGVERFEIQQREIVAGGQALGLAGAYERLAGRVYLTLQPGAAANSRVVDLDRAPRDAEGRVHYSADFYILKPVDSMRGNGTLLFEVSNRGSKAMVRYFNRGAARSSDPVSLADLGDAFLMRQGYTLVWVGWQFDVPRSADRLRLYPAYATAGEEPIRGLVRADHVFPEDATTLHLGNRGHQAYPVADEDDPRNVLTERDTRLGERRVIPRERWSFAREEGGQRIPDPHYVYLADGFKKGKIYEVVYVAEDPAVVGLGMTAVRDAVSYLRRDPMSPTPGIRQTLGFGISQTGRFLRTWVYQGFNADTQGRPVFDGVWAHTAGAGRGSFNHRFGQPSRDAHPYSAFFYPTDIFPFTGAVQRDPETGLEDGLLLRLRGTPAMPRIFFTNSGYEYWGRAAALIHSSLDGQADVAPGPEVRIYNFASTQHFVDRFPPQPNDTRYAANPANFLWNLRALLLAMNGWISDGVEPPPSRVPRIDVDTLVPAGAVTFPAIPGVEVPRRPHEAYRADYGPRFRGEGIVDRQPPALGPPFPALVAQVDADGNELGGLRLPEVSVPLATYTAWNWRAAGIGAPTELADFRGSFLPFACTEAEARAAGDPRQAVQQRYANREAYLGRYALAALEQVEARYLIAEDLPEIIDHARWLWDLVCPEP